MSENNCGEVTEVINLGPARGTRLVSKRYVQLTDNELRHCVVGIVLNNIIVPSLRVYIDKKLDVFYRNLVSKYRIDSPELNTLVDPASEGFQFEYRSTSSRKWVPSRHELAMLYMADYMVHFKEITDSGFDASATLSVLGKGVCFSDKLRRAAQQVRFVVRNKWAHYDETAWTMQKYQVSFDFFDSLVSALDGNLVNTVELKNSIQDWRKDGVALLGKDVEQCLMNRVRGQLQTIKDLVLKRREEPPELIGQLNKYTDSFTSALTQVKSSITSMHSDMSVGFQKVIDHVTSTAQQQQQQQQQQSPPSSVLFTMPPRNLNFCGRAQLLDEMKEVLKRPEGPELPKFLVISGLGGVGKTSLAVQVAHDVKALFPGGIYWLTADSELGDNTIRSSLFGLVRQYGIMSKDLDDKSLLDTVIHHIKSNADGDRCLIVIDNLDLVKLSPLANKLVNGSWLNDFKITGIVTTRLRREIVADGSFFKYSTEVVSLESFNEEDGVAFLKQRVRRNIDDKDCVDLVEELGGLPLALDQAGAYINISSQGFQISEYVERLRHEKTRLRTLNKKLSYAASKVEDLLESDESRLAVKTTWSVNMAAIKEENPTAEKISHVLAFLSPRFIPKTIFNPGLPELQEPDLVECLTDDLDINDVICSLTRLSLFSEIQNGCVQAHRLVQDIIREDVKMQGRTEITLQNALSMLAHALSKVRSPEEYLSEEAREVDWTVPTLVPWSIIMENVVHFLDQHLTDDRLLNDEDFPLTAKLSVLDHAAIHAMTTFQNSKAKARHDLMIDIMIHQSNPYVPKFSLAVTPEDVEKIGKLMEPGSNIIGQPAIGTVSKLEEQELTFNKLMLEGNTYMEKKEYLDAIRAFNSCLDYELLKSNSRTRAIIQCMNAHVLNGSTSLAKVMAEEALALAQDNVEALSCLSQCYFQLSSSRITDHHGIAGFVSVEQFSYQALCWVFSALSVRVAKKNQVELPGPNAVDQCQRAKSAHIHVVSCDKHLMHLARKPKTMNRVILLRSGHYTITGEDLSNLIGTPGLFTVLVGDPYGGKDIRATIDVLGDTCISDTCFLVYNIDMTMHDDNLGIVVASGLAGFVKCNFRALLNHHHDEVGLSKEDYNCAVGVCSGGQCFFLDCEVQESPGFGVKIQGSDGDCAATPVAVLKNCHVHSCQSIGVACKDAHVLVKGCRVNSNCAGIKVLGSRGQMVIVDSEIDSNMGGVENGQPNSQFEDNHPIDNNDEEAKESTLTVSRSSIHHNIIGYSSINSSRTVNLESCSIFSNRKHGLWLINDHTHSTTIQGNDIFRNRVGAILISGCKKVWIMNNHVHDHTGSWLKQLEESSYMSGINSKETSAGMSEPALLAANDVHHNDMTFSSISSVKVNMEGRCLRCNLPRAEHVCQRCGKVSYCNQTCLDRDKTDHGPFCDYFAKENTCIVEATVTLPYHDELKKYETNGRPQLLFDFLLGVDGDNIEYMPVISKLFQGTVVVSGKPAKKMAAIVSQFGKSDQVIGYYKYILFQGRLIGQKNDVATLELKTDRFHFSWLDQGGIPICNTCKKRPVLANHSHPKCADCLDKTILKITRGRGGAASSPWIQGWKIKIFAGGALVVASMLLALWWRQHDPQDAVTLDSSQIKLEL